MGRVWSAVQKGCGRLHKVDVFSQSFQTPHTCMHTCTYTDMQTTLNSTSAGAHPGRKTPGVSGELCDIGEMSVFFDPIPVDTVAR